MPERVLYESHPAMFAGNPILFILSILLCFAYGIGVIVLIVWWLRCRGEKLIITDERIIKREGILGRHENIVYHSDVRNIQIRQGLFQRMFGVGSVGIATSGIAGVEIEIKAISNPVKVRNLIDEQRRITGR
jgi:uncharacterized membrane protein YdbT with pleckstrin-like domain